VTFHGVRVERFIPGRFVVLPARVHAQRDGKSVRGRFRVSTEKFDGMESRDGEQIRPRVRPREVLVPDERSSFLFRRRRRRRWWWCSRRHDDDGARGVLIKVVSSICTRYNNKGVSLDIQKKL
tara:strand:+ start:2703 stop:3071 length:369 start_codon:yes stop_codon:yes gene_type:complete